MARRRTSAPAPDAAHYKVGRLDQVKVMAHPLRLRMLALLGEEPRTTKQVAEALGEKPTRLYHHVEAMARVGLIELVKTRQNRGATEKYYRAVARRFEVGREVFEREGAKAAATGTRAMLRTVLDAAHDEADAFFGGAHEVPPVQPLVARAVVYGSEAEVRAVEKKLQALLAGLKQTAPSREKAEGGKGGAPQLAYALSLIFHPWAGKKPDR